MGMEHSSTVIIGFTVDQDEFLMPFKNTRPEKFHMEDRFSETTGKKLKEQRRVVDSEEAEVYTFEGEDYEDSYEVLDAIASAVKCDITQHGNYCTGEDMMIGIEPKGADGEGSTFAHIASLAPECDRIRATFKEKYGIDLGEPGVYSLGTYA